jgi:transporter family protein
MRVPTIWLLILIATITWGVWGLFDKRAVETGSPPIVLLISVVFQALVALAALVVLRAAGAPMTWRPETFTWAALSGIAISVGMVAYLYALSARDASWVLGITAGYPAVMVVGAVLFLGEAVTVQRLAGIACVVLGVYLIGLE